MQRCPVFLIPSLAHQDYYFIDGDFTWLSVIPAVWQQLSYNLSVITACVPTIKSVFDILSGASVGAIDVPYQLTAVSGEYGLQAAALTYKSGRTASHALTRAEVPRFSPDFRKHAICYTTARTATRASTNIDERDDISESERNLTDGMVVITEEVEVDFESIHKQQSCEYLPRVCQ